MRVVVKAEARRDIAEVVDFYEEQQEGLGAYFADCLQSDLEQLEHQGGIHELVFGLHRKLGSRFQIGIYYVVQRTTIAVVAILDCRRDPKLIADRLRRYE